MKIIESVKEAISPTEDICERERDVVTLHQFLERVPSTASMTRYCRSVSEKKSSTWSSVSCLSA